MTVKISKSALNLREELADLRKPSGIAGEAMLRAETPQEQFNLIGAGRKNLLINSLFEINQRGVTSVSGTSGQQKYTADRWLTYGSGLSMGATIQTVTLPNGITTKSHKTTATSSASGFLHPYQKVETLGLGYLAGKTVTLSSWVRTTVPNQTMRICDSNTCYAIGSEIPNDGEWHFVTAYHTLPDSTLFQSGANDYMQFHPAFGYTNIVSGQYIEFALPQLELGKVATPFEHRSYGEELALCKRYYQRITGNSVDETQIANGYFRLSNSLRASIQFLVEMRSQPSVSYNDLEVLYNNTVGPGATLTNVFDDSTIGCGVDTGGVSGTTGYGGILRLAKSTSAYIAFDAEL